MHGEVNLVSDDYEEHVGNARRDALENKPAHQSLWFSISRNSVDVVAGQTRAQRGERRVLGDPSRGLLPRHPVIVLTSVWAARWLLSMQGVVCGAISNGFEAF